MKRILILIVFVLLLTGCKATVDVSIDENKVSEKVTIHEQDTTTYNQIKNWDGFPVPLYYDAELESPLWMPNREKESGISYYDVTTDDSQNAIVATGNFSLDNYKRSSLVRNCFKLFNIINEDGVTIFSTSKGLICSFDNFDVVVKTPYKIVNSNASSIDSFNNTYTWNFTKSNRNNISIYFEVDFSKNYDGSGTNKSSNNSNSNDVKKDTNVVLIITIITILIFIILLITLNLYRKKKKNSSI